MDVKEVVLDFRLIKLLSPARASALPITILFVPFMFLYIYTYDCLPRRYLYLTYIIKYRTHTNRRILDEKGVFYSNFQREVLYLLERGLLLAYGVLYGTIVYLWQYDMCTYQVVSWFLQHIRNVNFLSNYHTLRTWLHQNWRQFWQHTMY